MNRKHALLALNVLPLGLSLYFVNAYYARQFDWQLLDLRNLPFFLALVLVSIAGNLNSIWRYILVLKRDGLVVDGQVVGERLMFINLVSFFFPFGIVNYAAQLALVYRNNPKKLLGRAFVRDKLMFLGVIVACFLLTFGGLTPRLAASLGIPGPLVAAAGVGTALSVVVIAGYLWLRGYTRFMLAQLAVFVGLNACIALLLVAYLGATAGAFVAFLEKIFAYAMAITFPVSLGGVGPRELVLLFQVDDPAARTAILNFCILWFFALMAAALLLFLARRPVSRAAARCYRWWLRREGGGPPADTMKSSRARPEDPGEIPE